MKFLYLNLNIFDTRCDGRDNTKNQCSCISIAVSSKTEWLDKKKGKQHEGYYEEFYCLLACLYKMGNFKWNKGDRFSVGDN